MKQLKKPTREQRKLLEKWKLNPADWLVERDTPTEMKLVHRHFDSVSRTIHKEKKNDY